jgi:hypothetical protein
MRFLRLLILAAILFGLYVSNPDMGQFEGYVEARSEAFMQRTVGDGVLGGALSDLGASLLGSQVGRFTDRSDYFLFSLYDIDLDGKEQHEQQWRFLGLAGQFIPLQQPAALNQQE